MDKENRQTVLSVLLGILIYFVIVSVPVLIFTENKLKCELGLLAGTVASVGMLFHMNHTINKSMYMERGQSSYLAWCSIGRLVVLAGLIVLAVWSDVIDAILMVMGAFGLKIAAYIQPILIKRFEIKNKK